MVCHIFSKKFSAPEKGMPSTASTFPLRDSYFFTDIKALDGGAQVLSPSRVLGRSRTAPFAESLLSGVELHKRVRTWPPPARSELRVPRLFSEWGAEARWPRSSRSCILGASRLGRPLPGPILILYEWFVSRVTRKP